ncbi:MAG: SDR family oxidoreductase [Chloroflexota bacterium]
MSAVANKVVIVTGASAGIGRATAVSFAQAGATVVVTARREPRLETLMSELAQYPGEHLAVVGNIQKEAFAQALISQVVDELGRVDIVVNNAGVGQQHSVANIPSSALETVFKTNLFGLIYVTQAAVAQMKRQGGGHLVNVSSIVGQRPFPQGAVYSASKTAVNFISRGLRMELRQHNIRVTTVYPGLTATEFAQARLGEPADNRFGLRGVKPERVAKAIVKSVQNGRSECYATWFDWAFTHLNRLFPRTLDRLFTLLAKSS